MDYEGFLHGEMLDVLVTHLELSFELFCFCLELKDHQLRLN